eukprot:jgi/Bigna1/135416/aug1.29_g10124
MLRCLPYIIRPKSTLPTRRKFLYRAGETMARSSYFTQNQEEEILRTLKQRGRMFFSANRVMDNGRKGPENKEVQAEIRKKVRSHLELAWEDTFKGLHPFFYSAMIYHSVCSERLNIWGSKFPVSREDSERGFKKTWHSTDWYLETQMTTNRAKYDPYLLPASGTFYDLGSGVGRGVIVAALVGSFSRVCGIEVSKELYKASIAVQNEFETRVSPAYGVSLSEMNFIQANFTKNDWSDGNVIFINSTCFSKSLMEKIAAKAVHLVPGSCVVTLTQPIVSQYFELLESKKLIFTFVRKIRPLISKRSLEIGARSFPELRYEYIFAAHTLVHISTISYMSRTIFCLP